MSNNPNNGVILNVSVTEQAFLKLCKEQEIRQVFRYEVEVIPRFWTVATLRGVQLMVEVDLDPTLADPVLGAMSQRDRYGSPSYHEPLRREWSWDGSKLEKNFQNRPDMQRALESLGVNTDALQKVKSLKVGEMQELLDQSTDEQREVIMTIKQKGDQFLFETKNPHLPKVKLSTVKLGQGSMAYQLKGEVNLKGIEAKMAEGLARMKIETYDGSRF